MTDTRYPYTYACDFMRVFGGADKGGVKLSRADASKMREQIAKAIGMPDEELAKKLADYYQANEREVSDYSIRALTHAMNGRD